LAKVLYSHDLNFFTDGLCVKLKLGSDKRRIGQNEALEQMPVRRLFALTALVVNPPLYLALKGSAYVRHRAFNRTL
jgi:hypothetical protein